jgi:hypothetical protein
MGTGTAAGSRSPAQLQQHGAGTPTQHNRRQFTAHVAFVLASKCTESGIMSGGAVLVFTCMQAGSKVQHKQ